MDADVNSSERPRQVLPPSERPGWYRVARVNDPKRYDLLEVHRRFAAWLLWWMARHPKKVPSRAALAELLNVQPATVSYLLRKNSVRLPATKTLVKACELTGFGADALLFSEPPEDGA